MIKFERSLRKKDNVYGLRIFSAPPVCLQTIAAFIDRQADLCKMAMLQVNTPKGPYYSLRFYPEDAASMAAAINELGDSVGAMSRQLLLGKTEIRQPASSEMHQTDASRPRQVPYGIEVYEDVSRNVGPGVTSVIAGTMSFPGSRGTELWQARKLLSLGTLGPPK